jgi:CubicO group peptidase (beta-lactamase class C family)
MRRAAFLLLAACSTSLPSPNVPLPGGWQREATDELVVVTAPEPELRIAVAVVEGVDPEAALAHAWSLAPAQPPAKHKRLLELPSSKEPYEKSWAAEYDDDPREIVWGAWVRLYAGRSYVVLLSGPLADVKKRAAQMREVIDGVLPAGVALRELGEADAVRLTDEQVRDLETWFHAAREKLNLPGASLAVVQDGRVLTSIGSGHADLAKTIPMTPRTHMMLGSITKSFTGLLIARLVEQGKLRWDQPVTELYPAFRVASAERTAEMRLWHLMCACTGVPRRDLPLLFEFSRATPESVLAEIAHYELLTGFGETFQYSNQLVAAAGYVVASAMGGGRGGLGLGERYGQLLRREVLEPLGMTDSFLWQKEVVPLGRYGQPHSEDLYANVSAIDLAGETFAEPYAPAGALWSTADDMAKLLVALTGDGKGLPAHALLEELWKPRVSASADASYGLGWGATRWKGTVTYGHSGGTLGFISYFGYVPAARAGFVVLTNGQGGAWLQSALIEKMRGLLFAQPDTGDAKLAFLVQRVADGKADALEQTEPTVEPARLAALAGEYEETELGVVKIRAEGARAVIDTGELAMAFRPRKKAAHDEQYIIVEPPLTGFEFWATHDEGGTQLHFEPQSQHYVLRRRAESFRAPGR